MPRLISAIGRVLKDLVHPGGESAVDVPPHAEAALPESASGIHPGLTDEQLVVLLTAAACEVLETPARIGKFRPLTAKDWSWVAQGRMDLHVHRLK